MTITYAPTDAMPGDTVTLSIVDADSSHFALTSVPSESELELGLLYDNGGNEVDTFVPDVSGFYEVSAFEVREFRFPPSFPGDPAGAARTELVAVDSGTVAVCDPLDLFVVDVNGNRFRAGIIVRKDEVIGAKAAEPNNEITRVVLLQPSVQAAVAALPGVPVATLGEDLIAAVNALRANYEGHRTNNGGATNYHVVSGTPAPDNINVVERAPAESIEEAFALLDELAAVIQRHMINVPPAAAQWHEVDDTFNPLLTSAGATMREKTAFLADLVYRRYGRHLDQFGGAPHVHATQDVTNVPSPPTPLSVLIATILDELAKLTTTAPAGEQPGAVNARHMYGFDRTT